MEKKNSLNLYFHNENIYKIPPRTTSRLIGLLYKYKSILLFKLITHLLRNFLNNNTGWFKDHYYIIGIYFKSDYMVRE